MALLESYIGILSPKVEAEAYYIPPSRLRKDNGAIRRDKERVVHLFTLLSSF